MPDLTVGNRQSAIANEYAGATAVLVHDDSCRRRLRLLGAARVSVEADPGVVGCSQGKYCQMTVLWQFMGGFLKNL